MRNEQYSPEVERLIELYGYERFMSTWLEIHGYPPTWEPSIKECVTVQRVLVSVSV